MSDQILYRTIDTPDGAVDVRINRRGCTGEWTPEADAAMAELVNAAIATVKARDAQRAAGAAGETGR